MQTGVGRNNPVQQGTPTRGALLFDHFAITPPVTVSPGLIDHSMALFAPTQITQTVTPGLINHGMSLFTPKVNMSLTPGLINHGMTLFTPTFTLGNVNVSPGLISHAMTTFSPQVNLSISMGLISHAMNPFSPQVNMSVSMGLISHAMQLFSPTFTLGNVNVTPGLISHAMTLFSPQVNMSTAGAFINHSMTLFSPQVNLSVAMGLINHSMSLFSPQVNMSVSPALISHAMTLFSPQINQQVVMGLISHAMSLFSPTINQASGAQQVTPGLIDHSMSLFSPTASSGVATGLIDHSMQVFAPSQITQVATTGLINHAMQVFAPSSVNQTVGGTVYAYDRFNRADGPIGTADSGHTWTDFEDVAATWSVVGNTAQITATSAGNQATTTLDSGLKTVAIESLVTFVTAVDCGLVVGLVDNSNYALLVLNSNGNTHLWMRVAGAFTQRTSDNIGAFGAGTTIKVRLEYNNVTGVVNGYVNGALRTTYTMNGTELAAIQGTRQGIRQYDNTGTAAFDNVFISSEAMLPIVDHGMQVFAPSNAQQVVIPLLSHAMVAYAPSITGGGGGGPVLTQDVVRLRRRKRAMYA